MATKIRGITVEIGGDVSGLDKSLKTVNGEIKNTQAQLKDVERLLKLDPTNTELLRQKHKLLGDQVKQTADKLDELHAAEQELQNSGVDKNSDQFMALQREIAETENKLDSLKDAAAESNVALSKIGETASRISDGASKVAGATKAISGAAAGALVGIAGVGIAAAASADDYNTLAKQTGFSTETLQKAKYASDLVDVSFESLTGSAQKMVGRLRTDEQAFADLGVATRFVNGELRPTEDIFFAVVEALSAMENETERDVAAQTIFGKSAAELSGIIDDGGAAFRQYGQDAADAGLILSQDTLDSLNAVNDKLDQTKANMQATLATTGASALEALLPVLDPIIAKIGEVLEWIGQLDEGQIRVILGILAVVAAISPLASAISGISNAVNFLTTSVIPGVSKAIDFVIANPIVLLIAAIVALVVLIATKGDEIQALLQRLDDWLQGIFARDWTEVFGPGLGDALNAFFANVKNIWDGVKKVFDGLIDFIRGVFTGDWERAWTGVKNIFKGAFDLMLAAAKAPVNGIIGLINGLISGINAGIRALNKIHFSIPSWVPGLGGNSFGFNLGEIGKIPYLARGGVLSAGSAIVGEAGPELLTMDGSRAIVQPLSSAGGTVNHNLGGVRINVYGAPGQDVRQLAEIVMDEIQDATARRGAVFA